MKNHWECVHEENDARDVSWFQAEPAFSLRFLQAAGATPATRILEVGCGISGLASPLLDRGYRKLTALDVSGAALAKARARVGDRANEVTWVEADVIRFAPAEPFDVWHDRAVFHFLTAPEDRARYVDVATRAVVPGGHVILATFAPDGPEQCSGLPVARYAYEDLTTTLGPAFEPVQGAREVHRTPWGADQAFTWGLFRRR